MRVSSLFERIAADTWDRLLWATKLGVTQNEETITDVLLLELARAGLPEIRLLKTSKPLESSQGTDWEWWIGASSLGWLRYAVQAKRLDVGTGRYDELGHTVNGQRQIDILRTYAAANRAVAIYCFYNYAPHASPAFHWQCNHPFSPEQLGCTVTPLRVVENALATRGTRSFDRLHRQAQTRPLRCLVACPLMLGAYGRPATASVDARVRSALFEDAVVYPELPPGLVRALETGEQAEFDPDFYSAQVETYPERIMVVDVTGTLVGWDWRGRTT